MGFRHLGIWGLGAVTQERVIVRRRYWEMKWKLGLYRDYMGISWPNYCKNGKKIEIVTQGLWMRH